jgi:hypothetical protein
MVEKSSRSAVAERQAELEDFCARLSGQSPHAATAPNVSPVGADLDDEELLERALSAANGSKFARLWAGDASAHGGDASAADLALAGMLAFWSGGDLGQMDRLFRRSALMRAKWDERHYSDGSSYGQHTLERALERVPATKATKATEASLEVVAAWPRPLHSVAFHGVLGRLVAALEPHTETDPAALLVNALVAVGCLVGSDAHILVGNDRHPARLFAALVGETAKARKGTSWGPIRDALTCVDATWIERVMDGLASGEGLIWAVHDPIRKLVTRRTKDGPISEDELVDAGVADKRLLVVEGEFARVLSVMSRPESTLSAIVRSAWDTGALRILTKNSPATASGAHICVIGHITKSELLAKLSSNEAGNGFGNRFLWVCVRRSKVLPFGGQPEVAALAEIIEDLGRARQFAQAKELWQGVYPELSEGHPGLEGALTARAEAQVLRMALIYALLDRSQTIMSEHLRAALEVWRYCAESAAYIFGKRSGDPIADEILVELRKRGSLDRTAIRDLFSKHQNVARINEALNVLQSLGRVRVEQVPTEGRPREVWHAL